jgi:hypothetical protein
MPARPIGSSCEIRRTPGCASSPFIRRSRSTLRDPGVGIGAVGYRDGDTIIWYWIGSHAEYDRLIS